MCSGGSAADAKAFQAAARVAATRELEEEAGLSLQPEALMTLPSANTGRYCNIGVVFDVFPKVSGPISSYAFEVERGGANCILWHFEAVHGRKFQSHSCVEEALAVVCLDEELGVKFGAEAICRNLILPHPQPQLQPASTLTCPQPQ